MSRPGLRAGRDYAGVMTASGATTQDAVEIERKFDVDESTSLPAFDGLPGVFRVGAPVELELDALYFDTEDLALAASRITLRRRSGGEDDGWHLKTLVDSDTRQEFHEPLGSDPETIPGRLLRQVRVHVRDRAVIPVVRLRSRRIVHRLFDAAGGVLAEVCDDRVRADGLVPEAQSHQWREWEVELIGGDRNLLDAAQVLLTSSGAQPSAHASKLARALRDRPQTLAESSRPDAKSSAGQVLLAYVATTLRMLWTQDPRVRADEPDSVHQFRVALRRLRSALRTFRPLVDHEVADSLWRELTWMAGTLGVARDLQVLHDRIGTLISTEPLELILGPVSTRIDEHFVAELLATRLDGLTSLDDTRYFRLLDALDSFLASPPLSGQASKPARHVVPDLIAREVKRLRARVRDSEAATPGITRDRALHEVRKGAKRLRYAADAAAPVGHRAASRLAAAAEEIQSLLGEHQDSVAARALLRRWAGQSQQPGDDLFSYGRLHAREECAAKDAEERFRRAWKRHIRHSLRK